MWHKCPHAPAIWKVVLGPSASILYLLQGPKMEDLLNFTKTLRLRKVSPSPPVIKHPKLKSLFSLSFSLPSTPCPTSVFYARCFDQGTIKGKKGKGHFSSKRKKKKRQQLLFLSFMFDRGLVFTSKQTHKHSVENVDRVCNKSLSSKMPSRVP